MYHEAMQVVDRRDENHDPIPKQCGTSKRFKIYFQILQINKTKSKHIIFTSSIANNEILVDE